MAENDVIKQAVGVILAEDRGLFRPNYEAMYGPHSYSLFDGIDVPDYASSLGCDRYERAFYRAVRMHPFKTLYWFEYKRENNIVRLTASIPAKAIGVAKCESIHLLDRLGDDVAEKIIAHDLGLLIDDLKRFEEKKSK